MEEEKMTATTERANTPTAEDAGRSSLKRLRFVLLIVTILCGGNAVGILAGVCLWQRTGNARLGILLAVILTLAAFGIVLAIALRRLCRAEHSAERS
jgi:uncharacterized membrane protein YhaH (DUF805 family)